MPFPGFKFQKFSRGACPRTPPSYAGHRILLQSDFKLDPPLNKQSKETLRSHEVPNRPWAKVRVDIFTFNERNYLITVDYFSGFWEIDLLKNVRTKTVIWKMKSQFTRYLVPDVCMLDNGPQFVSKEYHKFSKSWKFQRITSSPRHLLLDIFS